MTPEGCPLCRGTRKVPTYREMGPIYEKCPKCAWADEVGAVRLLGDSYIAQQLEKKHAADVYEARAQAFREAQKWHEEEANVQLHRYYSLTPGVLAHEAAGKQRAHQDSAAHFKALADGEGKQDKEKDDGTSQ